MADLQRRAHRIFDVVASATRAPYALVHATLWPGGGAIAGAAASPIDCTAAVAAGGVAAAPAAGRLVVEYRTRINRRWAYYMDIVGAPAQHPHPLFPPPTAAQPRITPPARAIVGAELRIAGAPSVDVSADVVMHAGPDGSFHGRGEGGTDFRFIVAHAAFSQRIGRGAEALLIRALLAVPPPALAVAFQRADGRTDTLALT
jgi:hypothetical protein